MDRFDNIATADLVAREAEARSEAYELRTALRDRLVLEASKLIKIGEVYRVTHGRLAGRLMRVEGINAGISGTDFRGKNPWIVYAWGRMNGKSSAGDGWTIKRQQVSIDRLTTTEEITHV
jgi:hypothetical protein